MCHISLKIFTGQGDTQAPSISIDFCCNYSGASYLFKVNYKPLLPGHFSHWEPLHPSNPMCRSWKCKSVISYTYTYSNIKQSLKKSYRYELSKWKTKDRKHTNQILLCHICTGNVKLIRMTTTDKEQDKWRLKKLASHLQWINSLFSVGKKEVHDCSKQRNKTDPPFLCLYTKSVSWHSLEDHVSLYIVQNTRAKTQTNTPMTLTVEGV